MPHAKKQFHTAFLTAAFDCAAVAISVYLSYHVRFHSGFLPAVDIPALKNYSGAMAVILPVYLWAFRQYGLYQTQRHIRRIEEIFLAIRAVTISVIILMAITFFYRGLSYSRLYLVILWLVSILLLGLSRYLLIQWEYYRKVRKKDIMRVLLVGANRNARSIVQWSKEFVHYGREVVAVLSRDPALIGKHVEGVEILGTADQYEAFIDQIKPDEVILLDPLFLRESTADLIGVCEDRMIEFKIGADFYGLISRNVDVEYISSVPLLGLKALPLDDVWNRLIKRCFDLAVCLVILAATFPIWLAVILLIKCDDRGPIFYRQERVGRDQKKFRVLKFRTMKVDAEHQTGPVWARPGDLRRTRIGNVLRRWNLDELPQLLNVLRGDMSLVGPRPERPHFVNQFRESIPRYMARHQIKSGLTGWAQVNGYRGDTSIEERIKYDLYYMENWSLVFDIEILFMTLFAFRNAY